MRAGCFFGLSFGLIALWDVFTTFAGTLSVLGDDDVGFFMALILTLAVATFNVGTKFIFDDKHKNPVIPGNAMIIFTPLWFFALVYNIYTSFVANAQFLILRNQIGLRVETDITELFRQLESTELVIAIGLTVLVSGSTLLFSFFINTE